MKNDSDSIRADSVSTERTAAEAKRYAHGSDQLAEWLLEVEAEEREARLEAAVIDERLIQINSTKRRLQSILDANNETRCEGTKPNA